MRFTKSDVADLLKRADVRIGPTAQIPPRRPLPPQVPGCAQDDNPHRRMNKLEARYAAVLEGRRLAGDILWWAWESIRLRLADRTWLLPDFAVLLPSGELEFHETKGFMREDASCKLKIAAEQFPFTFWLIRDQGKGRFDVRKIPGRRT